ncbi:tetratricopeptide repeat protein [Frischella sp. Ac48]|uniref:tetratricopeptide repeat protein n=1 Tax=Frischella sp. Ac48 TaxID=2804531 RepID=UPI001C7D043E|nr:tetratricopeptide repeat protein [Frischella sp. Ac48]MBX4133812.1 tetratricopeptide repeat protein [Frischella sp. Ac48]
MKAKYLFIFAILVIMTGCQNSSFNRDLAEDQKIYILETTKNYGGLIEIYKTQLKHSDSEKTRYKLAQAYYLSMDYDSAERVLNPIIAKTKNDNVLVLYGRVLSEIKIPRYREAIKYLEQALQFNPKNGEAYNLKGIVEVKLGQYDAARYSFNKSRELFYDENKVLNNLATLSIMDKDYLTAYNYLNILYNKGYRNKTVLHNLLFTLVKLDKLTIAKQFCIEHKISKQPTILIEELKKVEPNNNFNFNELVPTADKMKKSYEKEQIIQNKTVEKTTGNIPNNTVNAALNKQGNHIMAVRSGEHASFSRIVLETNNKLASEQYNITMVSDHLVQIKIPNIELSALNTDQIIKKIKNSDRNFINVTAQYNVDKTLIINIQIKNVSKPKISYMGKGKIGHCLAIDFYIKN